MNPVPEYITLTEAARYSGRSKSSIEAMIDSGIVKSITLHGVIAVAKNDLPKPGTVEPGTPIRIRDAARKYNVASSTIARWVQTGVIPTVGTWGAANWPLIDEYEVKRTAAEHHKHGGKGKKLFRSKKFAGVGAGA
jgi:hypothetical protein